MNADQAFINCIERLETLINAETAMLRNCERIDFEALNLRKTHALLEFMQVSRSVREESLVHARHRIRDLQDRLAENAETLERHLQAIREISALIIDGIRKEESDGTYSINGVARR